MAGIQIQEMPATLRGFVKHLREEHSDFMRHVSATKALPGDAVDLFEKALLDYLSQDLQL